MNVTLNEEEQADIAVTLQLMKEYFSAGGYRAQVDAIKRVQGLYEWLRDPDMFRCFCPRCRP